MKIVETCKNNVAFFTCELSFCHRTILQMRLVCNIFIWYDADDHNDDDDADNDDDDDDGILCKGGKHE